MGNPNETIPTQENNSSPEKIIPEIKEEKIREDALQLESATAAYHEFLTTIETVESSDDLSDLEKKGEPWNEFAQKLAKKKKSVERVRDFFEDRTPETLGNEIFSAILLPLQESPAGNVEAEYKGSYVVVRVSNYEDFDTLRGISNGKAAIEKPLGYFTNTSITLEDDNQYEIPCVIVIEGTETPTAETEEHEAHHHYLGVYLEAANKERKRLHLAESVGVTLAINDFNKGEMSQEELASQFSLYRESIKFDLLPELITELWTVGANARNLRGYVERQFRRYDHELEGGAKEEYDRALAETQEQVTELSKKIDRVIRSFGEIEANHEEIVGLVGMHLMQTEAETADELLEPLNQLYEVAKPSHALHLHRSIQRAIESAEEAMFAEPAELTKIPDYEKLLEENRKLLKETHADPSDNYGFQAARQGGQTISEAIHSSFGNLSQYVRRARSLEDLLHALKKEKRIALETTPELEKQVEEPSTSTAEKTAADENKRKWWKFFK